MAEPVDTDFFKPPDEMHRGSQDMCGLNGTNFLFVGKWEERKGLKILLRAFLKEFPDEDHGRACLTILTSAYHSTDQFWQEIMKFVSVEGLAADMLSLERKVRVISNVPQSRMPALYAAASALVIPSRGEGWGRPHVEAMSCGVPVVATNWSGPTVYLTSAVGYPLRSDGLVAAGGWKGHKWAEPSETHLREILREIHAFPDMARQRGSEARSRMLEQYSIPVFSTILMQEIKRIVKIVAGRTIAAASPSRLGNEF